MILITGANGFVGKHLCHFLADAGQSVRRAMRGTGLACRGEDADLVPVGEIGPGTEWGPALRSVDQVVHLAARVHQMNDLLSIAAQKYMDVNTLGTERLARQAAAAGVRRFVYLSSVKVNGEKTGGVEQADGYKFTELSTSPPADPYAVSKAEAEKRLWLIAAETGMEVVVIRPPLVYGPGAKANFLRLLRLVDRGLPLPFASVRNARSLVFLGNLVDFVGRCLLHPEAGGETFLISDGDDLSTPALIRTIADTMGKPARLWPCPVPLLRGMGRVLGRSAEMDRLCDSLRVDIGKARSVLDWRPPFTVRQGIEATVQWYRQSEAFHG